MNRRVLILFAHPALEKSRVNLRLVAAARTVPGVTVHDLYEAYPDFGIDVRAEQERLLAADAIVLQHPFFWYSTPALIKEWLDLVLEHGWAYGRGGTALQGKLVLSVLTLGGPEESYRTDGFNRFTVRQLLAPMEQTWRLCGARYLAPFTVHATLQMTPGESARHADDYRALLGALVDGRLDLATARAVERLNADLSRVVPAPRSSAD